MSQRLSSNRRGLLPWLGVALIMAVVAATWVPNLDLPLGDSHHGRVLGRYALQIRNVIDLGFVDSGLGTAWAPYAGAGYAHHPPLANVLYFVFSWMFGLNAAALRLVGVLAGLATIPGIAVLLRALAMTWRSVLAAIVLTVGTGYFWIFGSLVFEVVFVVWLGALLLRVADSPEPGPGLVAATVGMAFVTPMSSWQAMAFSAVAGIWLWRRRGFDRVTALVGVSMVLSVLMSVAWIAASAGLGSLFGQLESRTTDLDFGVVEFIIRQLGFFWRFLPLWFLVVAVPALIAGVRDTRTRPFVVATLSIAIVFSLALPDNAYIHEYWNYWILLPVIAGFSSLLDRMHRRRYALADLLAGITVVASLAAVGVMALGDINRERFSDPSEAGRLAIANPPGTSQEYAWFAGVSAPRWLVFYWDRPPRELEVEAMNAGDVALVDIEEFDVLNLSDGIEIVDRSGDYAVVEKGPIDVP